MSVRAISILSAIVLVGFCNVIQAKPAPTPPPCRMTVADTFLPEFSCTGSASSCYAKATQAIKAQADKQNRVLAGCPVPPNDTYLSEFDFTNSYSDYSFVFLPGLFDTASQFWAFKQTFGANNGMRVVLPGHGASAWQGGDVTPDDWMTATRRAVNLASYLGKKVILVGQSTGAFMAVWAAAQPDIKISGVAVFEPAMKVRNYYGAALCYIPPFDLATIPHGRFFEENVNLGCVIRTISRTQTPQIMQAATLKRMSQIPFYIFVNPYDIVVNSNATLNFAQALQKAGGDVTIEAYSRKYEGIHMHAAVVRLPLRARYAERLNKETTFDETVRGRNSYAEFIATRFNLCDAATNADYLKTFGEGYDQIYLQHASLGRVDGVVAELQAVKGVAALSKNARETLQAYETLYTDGLVERDGWSFPTDGVHYLMHETNWTELSGFCCDTFAKTKRNYTSTFVGPTYSTLQQERAQVAADLAQGISGTIDEVAAHRLAAYMGGQESQFLLSPLIANDFSSMHDWMLGSGKCEAWQDIPAMDISIGDIKSEIHDFVTNHSDMEQTPDDQK